MNDVAAWLRARAMKEAEQEYGALRAAALMDAADALESPVEGAAPQPGPPS